MTNQEVVDYVREGVAENKSLETICENIMDDCLANDQTSSGLGYDNMSVMIIAILNGKTEKEWYQSIKEKVENSNKNQIPKNSVLPTDKSTVKTDKH
jgi:protein phosphatase 2C family protein 2/3